MPEKMEKVEASPTPQKEETPRSLIGVWGGQSVLLNVHEKGAGLDFSCAHAAIEQAIVPSQDKSFDLPGVYVKESFGPQREGDDQSQPARFVGRINGQTMTLTIKLSRTDESIGPLTLTFGKGTRVVKCQ